MAGWIKMSLSMEVGLGPGAFVLVGNPVPLPKKETEPQIFGHFYCGQTVGCIKMPSGMEVGLSLGHIMLDGDPAPLPKNGGTPPIFGPCLLWPNGWIDQDVTWYGGTPRPRRHCVR